MENNATLLKPVNVRLKLFQQNNIIEAKCEGFETEMFMPVLTHEGRLSIININPQHRCQCVLTSHIIARNKPPNLRLSSSKQSNMLINVHSTPENFRRDFQSETSLKFTSSNTSPNINQSIEAYCDENIYSPEQARDAITVNNKSLLNFNTLNVNTTWLNNRKRNLPVNVDITVHSDRSHDIPVHVSDLSLENVSNIDWPQSPLNEVTNNLTRTYCSESTNTEWRKVLTPVRTYSRLNYSPNSTSPLVKKNNKNNLKSSTQGIKPEKSIVQVRINKRPKLDEKINISPKSFKNQFQYKKAEKQSHEIQKEYKACQNELLKKSAFILLTTPVSNQNCFSRKLQQQFQMRCLNKGSSTYPKYKKLASVNTSGVAVTASETHGANISEKSIVSEYTIISKLDSSTQ